MQVIAEKVLLGEATEGAGGQAGLGRARDKRRCDFSNVPRTRGKALPEPPLSFGAPPAQPGRGVDERAPFLLTSFVLGYVQVRWFKSHRMLGDQEGGRWLTVGEPPGQGLHSHRAHCKGTCGGSSSNSGRGELVPFSPRPSRAPWEGHGDV